MTLVRSDGKRYRTSRRRRPARRHLLSAGLATCGVCGQAPTAQVRGRGSGEDYVQYLCDPRLGRVCVSIVGHFLERRVTEELFAAVTDHGFVRGLIRPAHDRIAALTVAVQAVDDQLAELARAWGSGELTRVEWTAARAPLVERAERLRDEIAREGVPVVDLEALPERWLELGLMARRAAIVAVFDRIEVRPATTRSYDPRRIVVTRRGVHI